MPISASRVGRRSLSPLLRKQLDNLEKDAESRKSAMKVLKSFVEDLDSKSIPLFLAEVSQEKGPNMTSKEYTISLYEVLARFHGRKIVPQIDNIMSTIVKTLMSSAGSFPLQQACSKVVPAIARYSIEPSTPEYEKPKIIYSLCKPLSDILMNPPESAASGSALCLKALVESENWRFASNEIVNEVCLRVAGALEESLTQTNSHMGLAMTLASRNNLVIEAYARSIIRSGILMLTGGSKEVNLHKRLTAIQMIKCLMKCVDSRSISSELETIMDVMEKCDLDPMECVRGAAIEALHTAKTIYSHKFERNVNSVSSKNQQSNFSQRYASQKAIGSLRVNRDESPGPESPESQTVNSFAESPLSSCNFEYGGFTRRRLWKNENGGVDISLKDGLISEVGSSSSLCLRYSEDGQFSDEEKENSRTFSGFAQMNLINAKLKSATLSPQRLPSQLDFDNVKILTTPRKLIHPLQDPEDSSSESYEKQAMKINTGRSSEIGSNPITENSRKGLNTRRDKNRVMPADNVNYDEVGGERNLDEDFMSVSSTQYLPTDSDISEISTNLVLKENSELQTMKGSKMMKLSKSGSILIYGFLLALLAVAMLGLLTDDPEKYFNLVPT